MSVLAFTTTQNDGQICPFRHLKVKGHRIPEVKATITGSSINTALLVIPGGMTSQFQVLGVVANKPFNDHLKQPYSEWLLKRGPCLDPARAIKKPSVTILCQWILLAWQCISPEVTMKGFKCCISNAMDGSKDDVLWNDRKEDRNVRSEGYKEKGTDC
jgi:hypothetical protein